MEPLQNLVYYAAVAKTTGKNTIILADYEDFGAQDFVQMAAKCLQYIPPLHNRFSHTTSNRRFICLIEDFFVYCAIMDEALCKAKAYMFLEHVRDATNVLLLQRDVFLNGLPAHSLHGDMNLFFMNLAASLRGIPQREKVRLREQELLLQSRKDAENEVEINSASAVAPLKEMSHEDFDRQTEHKINTGTSRSPHMPLIGKGKHGKKKSWEYDNGRASGSPIDSSREALNRDVHMEIMNNDNSPPPHHHTHLSGWQAAKERWWRNVKLIIILDLVACVLLLVLWLAVCEGVKCLKRN